MVNIPTSRDVAYVNPRSGRIAPSGPTVSVGAAVANMGEALTRVAYDLNDLRTSENIENQKKRGYDLEIKMTEFRDAEEQLFNKAREGSSESGIGFTREYIEGYQKRADDFVKSNFAGISEGQNSNARQTLLNLGNSLYGKANTYEQQAKAGFYDRTTNGGLDKIRTQIRSNAAPFEDLKKQGLAVIDAADMPEPWKAERRALWDSDAAESKWRWKFEQNPQEAISELRGQATGGVVDKIVGVESGGNATAKNPNSSATGAGQFIASTWMATVKAHRPDLLEGRTAAEVLALRNDGKLSREMTGYLVQDNSEFLRNQGVQATDGNVYLAHFLGPRGATQVLKADPSASVESIVGQGVVNANPFLKGMSAADVRAWSDKKMGGAGVVSTEYDSIPYDRREQLANWGETEYNQQRTQQRAAAKDAYSLLIATEPQNISQNVILNDQTLDNGDKAMLVNSLNAAMKERGAADAFIGALAQGNVSVNPFDSEQTKVADKAYDRILGAAQTAEGQQTVTSDFVARTGYIPNKLHAELRRGASGTDPQLMAQSMEAAMVLSKNAPASFSSFTGSADIQKKMDLYRAYTQDMGYSPDEAARRLIDANDPEKAARRDALLKTETVKKQIKDVSVSDVAGIFDKGMLNFAPSLGANPQAEAAMVEEYRSIYQESIVDAGGDKEAAKKAANERFSRLYGVSDFSTLGNAVIKYPVEKAYPAAPDGTHEWVRSQALEALKGEGINTEDVYLMPLPDGGTEKDIRAGKPPRYQVFYTDPESGTLENLNLPFYADPTVMQQQFELQKQDIRRQSEDRMIEGRNSSVSEQPVFDEIRKAREDAAERYKDYGEPFRAQKMRDAEREVRDRNQTENAAPEQKRTPPVIGGGGW